MDNPLRRCINLIGSSLLYGRDEDMQDEMVHPPERPWKWFSPLYQKDCVEGNMVQERSGRVSLARTVLCWAHITFKSLLRRLRMKSLVTMASHTNKSLHVCRFSCEPKKNWWMQTEKNKYSRESPDTDVIWASPCGDKTRKQAQNGVSLSRAPFFVEPILLSRACYAGYAWSLL